MWKEVCGVQWASHNHIQHQHLTVFNSLYSTFGMNMIVIPESHLNHHHNHCTFANNLIRCHHDPDHLGLLDALHVVDLHIRLPQ